MSDERRTGRNVRRSETDGSKPKLETRAAGMKGLNNVWEETCVKGRKRIIRK